MSGGLYGLYRGLVRNNVDPERRSRLIVDVPSIGVATLPWAEACISSAQPVRPNIGDAVWILFEAGDADHPVWVGVHPGHTA